jgi:hypothetical protein
MIQVNAGAGRVCINGSCAAGPVLSVPAGEYRFFVSTPRGDGRVHRVTVRPGEHKALTIDVDFEVALRTDAFVGFSFDSRTSREMREAGFASTLCRALGAREVVVLGELQFAGERHVALSAYARDRSTLAAVGTPGAPGIVPKEQMRRVAERLRAEEAAALGGAAGPTAEQDQSAALVVIVGAKKAPAQPPSSVAVAVEPRAEPSAARATPDALPRRKMKPMEIAGWVYLAVGVPVMIAGSYLSAREYLGTCESPTQLCPHTYSEKTTGKIGFPVMTTGYAAMGLGLLVGWIDADRPARLAGIQLAVDGVAVLVSGGLRYQTANYPIRFDQQPNGSVTKTTPESIRQQGTIGIAQMSVGGAFVVGGAALALVDQYVLRPRGRGAFAIAPGVSPSSVGLSAEGRF